MISSRPLIEPRPDYQPPTRMDHRIPPTLTTSVEVQPIGQPCNPSIMHLEPYSEMMSKKRNKPLMEKRRRQRINHAVEELRSLVTNSTTKSASKLEKADILDLTVKFVKDCIANQQTQPQLQPRQHSSPLSASNIHMFLQGHLACEMTLRKLLDQHLPKQSDHSTTSAQFITHMLKELSTNRQQFICQPNPSNLRFSNSAFSPVLNMSSPCPSSASSTSSSSHSNHLPFVSPLGLSSTSTDSFPDLSPSQLIQFDATGWLSEHRLGLPMKNSTPARICSVPRKSNILVAIPVTPALNHIPKPEGQLSPLPQPPPPTSSSATTITGNLWRPW